MKSLTHSLIAFFACAILTLTSFAGPEPIRDFKDAKDSKVIAPVPPPITWTGFYSGINAGYTWSENDSVDTDTVNVSSIAGLSGDIGGDVTALATGDVPVGTSSGFIGGIQFGYNYQFAHHFVVGLENDIQGVADASGHGSLAQSIAPGVFIPVPSSSVITSSKSIDYLGTTRGRLGFTITPTLLVYGTGGLAYGGVSSSTKIVEQLGFSDTPNPFGTSGRFCDTRFGWTAGAGLEWMFCRRWSIKAEYLYYNLGSEKYNLAPLQQFGLNGTLLETVSASASTGLFDGHVVRTGLNFHF